MTLITMADENETNQKRLRRYLEWAGAALVGALVTLFVTEIYSDWEKQSELGDIERKIQSEIITNLETIDRKLWRLEAIDTNYSHALLRHEEIRKFRSILNISYSIGAYRRHDEQIDPLNNGDAIRLFYTWLDDSAKMQTIAYDRYEDAPDTGGLFNSDSAFKGYVQSIQRQSIYLYLYGCKLVLKLQPSCAENLAKIQSEFLILKKTPDPIIDIPMEKLREFLTGWSRVIDENFKQSSGP